jgi:ubiquinol-cytochrome c reductase cytochrome c subunit
MSAAARIAVLVAVVSALSAAVASAQPPIVRPADERGLSTPQLGRELFAANCARCHGPLGGGRLSPSPGVFPNGGQGPPLLGVGRSAADFYLRTGRMPLANAHEQPERGRVELTGREIAALEDYVASLGGGPPIPAPDPARGNLAQGFQLFTEHCAGCHQVAAAGGVVTGARVPPLDRATPTQVAEAVRIGPYVMPAFSTSDISDAQLDSIVRYVEYAKHPDDAGGWGIGHLGPFPEGMVTWLIAALLLVAACVVIGERLRRS